jgi:hypothetical protein
MIYVYSYNFSFLAIDSCREQYILLTVLMFQSGPKFSIGSFILADKEKVTLLQPFVYTLNVRLLVKWDWYRNGVHKLDFCVRCDRQCWIMNLGDEHKKVK